VTRSRRAPRDAVVVEGLRVRALVGVFPHERKRTQPLVLDLELGCDASRPAREDDLAEALDYDAVARAVGRWCLETRPRLLETLAEHLARRLRREFGVPWLRLKIVKPAAVPAARAVGVVIERGTRA
jgi:7,8-dihydroneopterin aldolase/epimerase/oxygenase